MKGTKARKILQDILSPADIQINGTRPWDIKIHENEFYDRILSGGSLALGESYMDGWWDCEALDAFFMRLLKNRVDEKASSVTRPTLWQVLKAVVFNPQKRGRAFVIGKRHYDIGTDLFSMMLDKDLNYSCGYWEGAGTLAEAQADKCDLICKKNGLQPGMKVLDIGCGWGGFAKHAASQYGASVYGVTVSEEQADFAKRCLCDLDVTIDLKDYRDLDETFDAVVSIGMFEHVGYKNYRTYMKTVHRCLKPGGIFLLHTIGGNSTTKTVDPWIEKYIFPNSMLPSAAQITGASDGLFMLEDWHCFGKYYDKTLMAWYDNFISNWDTVKTSYDTRFYRMWTYYLLSCAGSFRAGYNRLWQIAFSKGGIPTVFRHSDHFLSDSANAAL